MMSRFWWTDCSLIQRLSSSLSALTATLLCCGPKIRRALGREYGFALNGFNDTANVAVLQYQREINEKKMGAAFENGSFVQVNSV